MPVLCRYLQGGCVSTIIQCEHGESRTNWGHVTQDLSAVDAHPIEGRVREDISANGSLLKGWNEQRRTRCS